MHLCLSGKFNWQKLSPRKIVMDIRDRLEEVGQNYKSNKSANNAVFDDGKSLFDYISKEEIYACTTCNACVEACRYSSIQWIQSFSWDVTIFLWIQEVLLNGCQCSTVLRITNLFGNFLNPEMHGRTSHKPTFYHKNESKLWSRFHVCLMSQHKVIA